MSGTALLITGTPASGTSALAGSLKLLGLDMGPEEQLCGSLHLNPLGNWEHQGAMRLNHEILAACGLEPLEEGLVDLGGLGDLYGEFIGRIKGLVDRDFHGKDFWGIKDPRLCRLIPIWADALFELGIHMKVVISLRGPEEVAWSIMSRRKISLERGLRVWENFYDQVIDDSSQFDREIVLYDRLMGDPDELWSELARVIPDASEECWQKVEQYLRPEFYHGRASEGTKAILCRLAEAWRQ